MFVNAQRLAVHVHVYIRLKRIRLRIPAYEKGLLSNYQWTLNNKPRAVRRA